jgi:single-strand DNA-binding protein
VVVHGKLSAHVWTNKAGLEVTTFEVEAAFVGHDLNRGTSVFHRRKLNGAGDESPATDEVAEVTPAPEQEPTMHAA